MTYGQYLHDGRLVDDRIENSTHVTLQKHLLLDYDGNFFRHLTDNGTDRTRRDDGHLNFNSDRADFSLECKDEWRTLTSAPNRGMAGAGAGMVFRPLSCMNRFFIPCSGRARTKSSAPRTPVIRCSGTMNSVVPLLRRGM